MSCRPPQCAAPQPLKRWAGAALEIVNRNFHHNLAVASMFVLCGWLLRPSPIALMIYGLTGYLIGIPLIARGESGKVTSTLIALALKVALFRTVCVVVLVVPLLIALDGVPCAATLFWDPAGSGFQFSLGPLTDLYGILTPGAFAVAGAIAVVTLSGRSVLLHYLCMSLLGLDWKMASVLANQGKAKNRATLHAAYLGGILLAIVTFAIAPVLMPFMVCFLSAFSYVAFKELFLAEPNTPDIRPGAIAKALQAHK